MDKKLFRKNNNEIYALCFLLVAGPLSLLGMFQKVPALVGILGLFLLLVGMVYFCIKATSESEYKDYYKESYEIEHSSIEDEIKKSMTYHRYQDAVLGRFETACRDLGIGEEQKDWLLRLLMEEKDRVDQEIKKKGDKLI